MNQRAITLFRETFGTEPNLVTHAPGRVNLIGEHIDYNDGLVLPAAINLGITCAVGPSRDDLNHLTSAELGHGDPFILPPTSPAPHSWSKYPAATAWAIGAKTPLNIAISSNLPSAGGGLSSSAALLLSTATAWNTIDKLGHSPVKLAQLCQLGENQFVGVNCGIMDQLASACGVAGHALQIDIPTLQITPVQIPEDITIVVLDTGVPRSLAESGYNERRAQCEEACRILDLPSLREANLDLLNLILNPTVKKRARHVITEIERVKQFAAALERRDLDHIGSLMVASHISLKDDYEVSCPELDHIVQSALQSPGCIGARLTGAGFGGAAVALINTQHLDQFLNETEQNYRKAVKHYEPALLPCLPANGAQVVSF
ncbi:MAG: galactokinase [Fimbriimonadaceae bacterium]